MNRLKGLNELLAKVEAGDAVSQFDPLFERAFYHSNIDMVTKVYPPGLAAIGDKNAAFELKKAVCPDHTININENRFNGVSEFQVELGTFGNSTDAEHKSLSVAILIAVIKAMIWEAEQATTLGGN